MWSPRWNEINRGNPKTSEKNLSQCHFVHHKSHWIDLDANPGRRGKRPATNRLSHGTAFFNSNSDWIWGILVRVSARATAKLKIFAELISVFGEMQGEVVETGHDQNLWFYFDDTASINTALSLPQLPPQALMSLHYHNYCQCHHYH
jgi:hypothetical protein